MENQTTTFPTTPNEEGFYFETEYEKEIGALTKVHANGHKIKTLSLSNGSHAVVRELLGKEAKDISRFMGKDEEKYVLSMVAVSTTINGKPETYEYFEQLKFKDYARLTVICKELNF